MEYIMLFGGLLLFFAFPVILHVISNVLYKIEAIFRFKKANEYYEQNKNLKSIEDKALLFYVITVIIIFIIISSLFSGNYIILIIFSLLLIFLIKTPRVYKNEVMLSLQNDTVSIMGDNYNISDIVDIKFKIKFSYSRMKRLIILLTTKNNEIKKELICSIKLSKLLSTLLIIKIKLTNEKDLSKRNLYKILNNLEIKYTD